MITGTVKFFNADKGYGFIAPAGGRQLDVPTRRGTQTASADGNRPRVEADHGGGPVAVRWRDGPAAGAAVVTAREVCVWDLGEVGESATAAVLLRIGGATVSRLVSVCMKVTSARFSAAVSPRGLTSAAMLARRTRPPRS